MLHLISSFTAKLQQNPKNVFLLDALGACLSAISLFAIGLLYHYIGLPQLTLFMLAGTAIIFAVYSLSCFYLINKIWKPFLLGITTANTLYSIVTASLIIQYYQSLTIFGFAYFVCELIILCVLIALEVKTLLKN